MTTHGELRSNVCLLSRSWLDAVAPRGTFGLRIPKKSRKDPVTHLHAHTHFSFGIGVSSPEVLATAAAERGYRALACTDTNGVYGAIEFQRACDAAGIRPILGAHLVTDDEETVALATDERGWAALCRAISAIHWDAGRPLLSEQISRDRAGLILLSRDVAFLERIAAASGTQDLYAELFPGKERHAV